MSIYSESDLIVPAVAIIAAHENGIGTSDLSRRLRSQLRPSGDDLTILANRSDDKFSQKVRNLKSHETLERKGLATFTNGKYCITENGSKFASEGSEISLALTVQGFSETQKQAALDRNYSGILIEEGDRTIVSRRVVRRSSLLKEAALKHFADAYGSIACAGCGFRSEKIYGTNATGLIEIHHIEPLYLTGQRLQTSIDQALKRVSPLCPNCHRIVHRDRAKCMTIAELKGLINSNRQSAPKN
jgi:predicted HNH restriction endonuclease